MNVKAVVKVMNFHALLHVESARKEAEKYRRMEQELSRMMDLILNNRNLQLDKEILNINPNGPDLNIYIGSDLGFCGAVNSSVWGKAAAENQGDAIVIGKKVKRISDQIFFAERESMEAHWDEILDILTEAVEDHAYSRIFLIYNHYHNMSSIECVKRQIFPIEREKAEDSDESQKGDFMIMGSATDVLKSMMITYLGFEIRIAAISSYASENIARRNATTDSLKKIDEMEEEEMWAARKERSQKAFKKVIDSYIKKKK